MNKELSVPPDRPVPWVVYVGPVKTELEVVAQTWFEARKLGRIAARALSPFLTFSEDDVRVRMKAREARRDGTSVPIELALDGRLEKRWRELEEEMKKLLAERPS